MLYYENVIKELERFKKHKAILIDEVLPVQTEICEVCRDEDDCNSMTYTEDGFWICKKCKNDLMHIPDSN